MKKFNVNLGLTLAFIFPAPMPWVFTEQLLRCEGSISDLSTEAFILLKFLIQVTPLGLLFV